jgi:hypothetical protein
MTAKRTARRPAKKTPRHPVRNPNVPARVRQTPGEVKSDPDTVFVRIGSHRARKMFGRFLGREPRCWYTLAVGACFHDVTRAEWARFVREKRENSTYWHGSITKARVDREELGLCWTSAPGR